MSDFRLAKIRDHIPFGRVEKREDRNPSGDMGAGGNVEIDDTSVERRGDFAVGEMEFLEIDGGDRPLRAELVGSSV